MTATIHQKGSCHACCRKKHTLGKPCSLVPLNNNCIVGKEVLHQSISPSSTSFGAASGTLCGASTSSSSSSSSFLYNPSCSRGLLFPRNLKLPRPPPFSESFGLVLPIKLDKLSAGAVLSISRSSMNWQFSLISTVFSICTMPKEFALVKKHKVSEPNLQQKSTLVMYYNAAEAKCASNCRHKLSATAGHKHIIQESSMLIS